MRKILKLLGLFLWVITIVSCSRDEDNSSSLSALTLEKRETTVEVGRETAVNILSGNNDYQIIETDASRQIVQVALSSDNKSINIKGLKAGNTEIAVVDNKSIQTQTIKITVTPLVTPASDYELSADGKHLIEWKNKSAEVIDMQSDAVLSQVEFIGSNAFNGVNNLTHIVLPDGLASIAGNAFEGTALTSIVIPNQVVHILESAFLNCKNLAKVTLSSNLKNIYDSAFKGCTALTAITLPSSVENIGSEAFQGCTNLADITVQAVNPPQLGDSVFYNQGIKNIYVPQASVIAYITASKWTDYRRIIKGF